MDKTLLDIIACPLCKGEVIFDKSKQELVCKFDRLAFPIKDDIPVMLETDAREISLEEKEALS